MLRRGLRTPGTNPALTGARTGEPMPAGGYPHGMADFKKGDKVAWNSHGSQAHGKVEKEITEETEAGGRKVKASKDDPQYLVKSDNGGDAVHKPSALKKD